VLLAPGRLPLVLPNWGGGTRCCGKTYERLWREHHEAEVEQLAEIKGWLDSFEKRVS
jgi:hypothetical protein